MSGLLEALFGPLAALECRRALGRRWVLLVRALTPIPAAAVLLVLLWFWWFYQEVLGERLPITAVGISLATIEGMAITAAVLLTPALLAGALAGEKIRTTLGLLLAAQVSSREIVLGRLAGGLAVVAALAAAGAPALLFIAGLLGSGLLAIATLLALPLAVALGSGGLALAASAVARRNRDALLMVYLLDLLLLLAPVFGSGLPGVDILYLHLLNPYAGIDELVVEDPLPALASVGWWLLLGFAGCAFAAGRLRPAYLREADGRPRSLAGRRRVPPVGDRPVLWKELYIERLQAYGRWVKALAVLIAGGFLGTSLVLAGLYVWRMWIEVDVTAADAAFATLGQAMEGSWMLVWLIQWAMGLRAAASIASERQRGTWDSLLLTPLEGPEIVLGKIYGGIAALRAFAVALLLGWTAGLACGALPFGTYVQLVSDAVVVGAFMVVIGTGFSLWSQTATKAMTLTIVAWLGAAFGTAVLAGLLALVIGLLWLFGWLFWLAGTTGATSAALTAGPPLAGWWGACYDLLRLLIYATAGLAAAGYLFTRFDSLAGRASLTDAVKTKKPSAAG